MVGRLIQWMFFGVLASLLPLAGHAVELQAAGHRVTTTAVLGHGELLLISSAIAFPAFGALLMSDAHPHVRGIFGGTGLLGLFIVAWLYGRFATGDPMQNQQYVVQTSVILFVVIVLVSALSVAAAKASP